MQTDVLIVGQGISGTMLSWWLQAEGKSAVVIDDGAAHSSSKVAAGIMNPVTGRRYIRTWLADVLFPFAEKSYVQLGQALNAVFLYRRNVIDFFPSPQMRNTFVDHLSENDTYLHAYPDQNRFNDWFHYDFGCGEIGPAYTVDLNLLLTLWRKNLQASGSLLEENFVAEDLTLKPDGVQYQHITAEKIVFCDGIACAQNPWFSLLPFSANKGEALIIDCPGLPTDHVFKRGFLLAPLAQTGTFWAGSNYAWEFDDAAPTDAFYQATTNFLNGWLKQPYTVLQHKAAVRPATVERRPFVGFHPLHPAVGILNGMGTKGTSLAPFFAHQLAQHIVLGQPLTPEADVRRFSRILSK